MYEYKYKELRPWTLTEECQELLLEVQDKARSLFNVAGAFSMVKLVNEIKGDTWKIMACVDRLVELGRLHDVTSDKYKGQSYRIFIVVGRVTGDSK